MKIHSVKIKGYRSYGDEVVIRVSPITLLVGPNGAGKSSVLEALDLFFNKEGYSPDDVNKDISTAPFELSVLFTNLPVGPECLNVDEGRKTSFEDEPYFLNQAGQLEVKKVYKPTAKVSVATFLRCYLPSDEMVKIIGESDDKLRKRVTDLGLQDLCGDMRVNSFMRRTLFGYYQANSPAWAERLVPVGDREAGFERILPHYALFKSDRLNNSKDSEVAEPVKYAVQVAIKEAQIEVDAATLKVKAKIQEILDKANLRLANSFGEDMPKFSVNIKPDVSKGFPTDLVDTKELDFGKQGSGISRLYMLNLMLSEAERKRQEAGKSGVIFAVEEPETSQHPDFQKKLIESLKQLSVDNQVMLTTHNPNLLSQFSTDSIRVVQHVMPKVLDGHEAGTLTNVVRQLGILPDPLPNAQFRVLVVVEGPSDLPTIELARHHHPDLDRALQNAWIVPCGGGGGNIRSWAITNHFCDQGVHQFFIVDPDYDEHGNEGPTLTTLRQSIQNPALQHILVLKRREIENYAHPDAIMRLLGALGDVSGIVGHVTQLHDPFGRCKTIFEAIGTHIVPDGSSTPTLTIQDLVTRAYPNYGIIKYKPFIADHVFSAMTGPEFIDRFSYTADGGEVRCEFSDWAEQIEQALDI